MSQRAIKYAVVCTSSSLSLWKLELEIVSFLIKIFQIDAFTGEAFKGNPAAVCLLEENADVDEHWMLSVAKEFNISETSFLTPLVSAIGSNPDCSNQSTAVPRFSLRWFTPVAEVLKISSHSQSVSLPSVFCNNHLLYCLDFFFINILQFLVNFIHICQPVTGHYIFISPSSLFGFWKFTNALQNIR